MAKPNQPHKVTPRKGISDRDRIVGLPSTRIVHDPNNILYKEIVCDCGFHTGMEINRYHSYDYLTSVVESHFQSHLDSYMKELRNKFHGKPDTFRPLKRT